MRLPGLFQHMFYDLWWEGKNKTLSFITFIPFFNSKVWILERDRHTKLNAACKKERKKGMCFKGIGGVFLIF